MAGLLITVGKDVHGIHGQLHGFFINHKGMIKTQGLTDEDISISKFSRNTSYAMSHDTQGDIAVWVVGTLIYKGAVGEKAVSLLKRDLRDNVVENLAGYCDGPFCIVIRKQSENGFSLVTDHVGVMNIYRYRSGQNLSLSTSSMALSRVYPVTVNKRSLAQFLRCASVYGSETIYNEIELLEPATIYKYTISPRGIIENKKRYWRTPIEVNGDISFREARDTVINCLVEGVAAISGEDLICDLTAGYDSRLILALLSMFRPLRDIQTFVFGPYGSREVDLVKGYRGNLGLMNIHLTLPENWNEQVHDYVKRALYMTDGEENIFVYAPILLAQEFKSKTHMYSLNGLGGEIFRDFWWVQEMYSSKRPANLRRLIRMRVLQYEYDYSIFSDSWKSRMTGIEDILKEEFERSISDMDMYSTYNTLQIDNLYFRQKLRRWAGRTVSSSNQLINSFMPLMLKRSAEAILSIPPGYKRNGRMVKDIVEKLSLPLSEQRMLNGTPCQNIRLMNAHRFAPLLVDYGKKGIRKVVQRTMNRTILLDRSISYPQPTLLLSDAFYSEFPYDSLITASFYDPDRYRAFYNKAREEGFIFHNQLGNILTLEMRMRGDNIQGLPS